MDDGSILWIQRWTRRQYGRIRKDVSGRPRRTEGRTPWSARPQNATLEAEREPAHDPLGRADDEQLIVERLVGRRIAEEIAHRDQHLPMRRTEVHERERLPHLHVEPAVERRVIACAGLSRNG